MSDNKTSGRCDSCGETFAECARLRAARKARKHCQHLDAYSETGRLIGGHRELRCACCGVLFVSLRDDGSRDGNFARVGVVERTIRNGRAALVRFGYADVGDSTVYAWNVEEGN